MVDKSSKDLQLKIQNLNELTTVSKAIIEFAGNVKVWLFYGEMGIGKTTLIKRICELLGVLEPVTSPTFNIVNEYRMEDSSPIYHFDFFRISNPVEALDIGYEEYFYSGNLCLVEWPEKISSLLPEENLTLKFHYGEDQSRIIDLKRYEQDPEIRI